MKAAILSVGDEILRGEVPDTNAAILGRILDARGIEVTAHSVIGDSHGALRDHLRESLPRVDIVCVSGGLGPTRDDITRWAVADVVGRNLQVDPTTVERMRVRFARRGKAMPKANERQALFPEGAEIIENPLGTAPGFLCRWKESVIVALPGVPFEMEAMADEAVDRALAGTDVAGERASRALFVLGMPESEIDARLGPLMDRGRNPLLGLSVTEGEVCIHMSARSEGDQAARSLLDEAEKNVRDALGDAVRGPGGVKEVLDLLLSKGWKIATAESCTGGLVADRITDVPGASKVFAGGAVVYTPQMKADLLGVRRETLTGDGEVSEAVAREMAEGICSRTGAQVGAGVTGWAGPTAGGDGEPVGLVWIAVRYPGGLRSRKWVFEGGRRRVKERAASAAVRFVLDCLTAPTIPRDTVPRDSR